MSRTRSAQPPTVDVAVRGGLPAGAVDYARDKVTAVLRCAHEPVLSVRVRLTRHPDPAVARPVVAQANLDVNGRIVRAGVEAATASEATDLLAAKLRRGFERIARPRARFRRSRRTA